MGRLSVITTGGTISTSTGADGVARPARSGADLTSGLDVDVVDLMAVDSSELTTADWDKISAAVRAAIDDGAQGVVVLHGTDTMEESAYLADLLLASDKPVVFTGAQRAADEPDADGPRNIADSIRLAAAPAARGLGAMICFEQEFHAARDVAKTHTSRTDTFMSWEHGKLGEIDAGAICLHRRPALRRAYAPSAIEPNVTLIRLAMGMDGGYLNYAADHGSKAIVLEGFGRGNTPPSVTKAVADVIKRGIPVIICSRCPRGRVLPVYGNGGATDLQRSGAIFAGDLSGHKARLLAAVLLGQGLDHDALRAEIEYLGG